MVFALTAPYIAMPPWLDVFTEKNKARTVTERLAQLMKNIDHDMATEFETMLYISSASLNAPLSNTWFKIYAHLFNKLMPEQDVMTKADAHITDYELMYLKDLRHWIFRKQMEHFKAKMKEEKKNRKNPQQTL